MEEGGCLSMLMDTGSAESHRLYLARRTVLEMLRDRGYAVGPTDIDLTLATFRSLYGESPDHDKIKISTVLIRDPSKRILVLFCGANPVKKATLRDIAAQYGKEILSRMIIVLQSNMTSQCRETMKDLFQSFTVETFNINELLANVTKHVLMPEHEILSAEDKEKLLKKYNVVETQLPRMLATDAIAKYYGLEKGTVLKITYRGELTENHVTYRCIM